MRSPCTASLQNDGSFSLNKATLTQLNGGTLPDGNYQVYLQATDSFGNTTTPQTLAFQLLTQATIPTNLQLAAGNDTGASNSDKITKTNQPTIQGNGKAGDIVQLLEGTTLLGQTTVGTDGKWQLTSTTLVDGTHNLTAQTIDLAGNISPSSTALNLNIDTVVPNLQLSQQLAGIVLTGTSRLAGQVTDTNITTISYQFDGAPAITLPTATQFDTPFDFTGINDGGHNLTVTATDVAGNIVSHTYGVTVARGNLLTIALLDDTGISNSDGVTSDINVRGQVADRTQISRLEFALDGSTNYTDLTAALQLDGTFRLLPAQLNSLAGGTLSFGVHRLTAIGVLADGTTVATATLNFTYQSAATATHPSLVLEKASDTGVSGDLVTSSETVNLVAKAAAGTSVSLGSWTLIADATGIATFTGVSLVLGENNFTLSTIASNGEIGTSTTTITRTNPDDVILTWNHIALAAIQREGTSAPAAARVLGMVHTAMYDAVNAIEQKYGVYRVDASAPTGADEIAAAAEAAFQVLLAIYPNQQAYFSAALTTSLADGATAAASAAGVALGDTVAANIITWRKQDGSRNPAAFNPSTDVGDWQPDLPNYDGALLPQWGKVTTFGLTSGSQFRPTGDPSLTSDTYTTAFTETLDPAKLTSILGTLTDKSYQLTFKLVDSTGATISSNNLSFILDTTAAQTTIDPTTETVTPTAHLTGTATDNNGGTSGRFKVDGGVWTKFTVNTNGTFDKVINPTGLTTGAHTVNVELADLAGNITTQTVSFNVDSNNNIYASPATNPGWGRVFGTGFSLGEGNSLITQNSLDVTLGGSGKRTIDFDLNTTFDKSDLKSTGKDRVAVYLVDSNNNQIALDATHPAGTPLFSLSETGSEIIPGLVKFDGTHVQIDVSNISETSGKLIVQLLNQDGDTGSKLTVTNFTDTLDPAGTPGTSVSPAVTPVAPGAATVLDSYLATLVD